MKHIIAIFLFTCLASAGAEVTNPVADFKSKRSLSSTVLLYKWTADLAGNGHHSVFLSFKIDFDEDIKDGQVPSWNVYIASLDGTSYVMSSGLVEGASGASVALPQIDPNHVFVGQITQLNKRGLVTVQTDYPKKQDPIRWVYALTVEGGHLKKNILAQYNPRKDNAIYDQYLSDSHRTPITPEEISP